MKIYGIKRLRESEIGNDTSHQAHIGLFQDVIISQGHHQKLIANLYFDDNVYTTLAFLDFIQNEDGTLRSPKIRKGNQDDSYIVNGVSYNSFSRNFKFNSFKQYQFKLVHIIYTI